MKKELLKAKVLLVALMMVATTAMFVACDDADDVDDDPSGQLPGGEEPGGDEPGGENPDATPLEMSEVTVERVDENGNNAKLQLSWPAVADASSYHVTVLQVGELNAEGSLVAVEKSIEDRNTSDRETFGSATISVTVDIVYGGKYTISVYAVGDGEEFADSEPKESEYWWYVAPMFVKGGSELSAAVAELLADVAVDEEVKIALEAGAEFTIDDLLDFGLHKTALYTGVLDEDGVFHESDKHAIVAFGSKGRLTTASPFDVTYINFDCTNMPASKPEHAVITMSYTQYPSLIIPKVQSGDPKTYYCESITIRNCNFKNVPGSLFGPGYNAWSVGKITVDNCIVQLNSQVTGDGAGFIDFYQGSGNLFNGYVPYSEEHKEDHNQTWLGGVQYTEITNTTIYNLGDANTRFFRMENPGLKSMFAEGKGAFTMKNSIVHSFAPKTNQFANNPGQGAEAVDGDGNTWEVEISDCIFYEVYGIRRIINGGKNKNNCKPETNVVNNTELGYDGSDEAFATNDTGLAFAGTATELDLKDDAKGGQNFKYTTSVNAAGDPRWK